MRVKHRAAPLKAHAKVVYSYLQKNMCNIMENSLFILYLLSYWEDSTALMYVQPIVIMLYRDEAVDCNFTGCCIGGFC